MIEINPALVHMAIQAAYDQDQGTEITYEAMLDAITAIISPVCVVRMNGRRFANGSFADIEVEFPSSTSAPPRIGTQLYKLLDVE